MASLFGPCEKAELVCSLVVGEQKEHPKMVTVSYGSFYVLGSYFGVPIMNKGSHDLSPYQVPVGFETPIYTSNLATDLGLLGMP